MSGQVQKPRPERKVEVPEESPQQHKSGEELKAELDEIMDEIDATLEENDALGLDEVLDGIDAEMDMTAAEDMVKSYIQKGGQ